MQVFKATGDNEAKEAKIDLCLNYIVKKCRLKLNKINMTDTNSVGLNICY